MSGSTDAMSAAAKNSKKKVLDTCMPSKGQMHDTASPRASVQASPTFRIRPALKARRQESAHATQTANPAAGYRTNPNVSPGSHGSDPDSPDPDSPYLQAAHRLTSLNLTKKTPGTKTRVRLFCPARRKARWPPTQPGSLLVAYT